MGLNWQSYDQNNIICVTIFSTPPSFLCLPLFISVYLRLYHLLSLTALEVQPLSHVQLLLCSIIPLSSLALYSILRSPLFPISVYHCSITYINSMYFDSFPQLDLSWAIHIVVLDSSVWWKYSHFASVLRNLEPHWSYQSWTCLCFALYNFVYMLAVTICQTNYESNWK